MMNHPTFHISSRAVSSHREQFAVGLSKATVVVFLTLFTLVVGCQTTGGDKFTYRDMPPSLLAVRRENAQTLDLTRLARASANSDVIDRGDVVEVTISAGLDEKDTVRLPVRVNDEGIATLPEIGPVMLAGMEMESAEAAIVSACIERQLYRRPNVTVTMKLQRTNRVTVMGAVKAPGVYALPRGRSDLLAAIVAGGGLEKDAGTIVEIKNPERPTGSRPAPIASGGLPGVNTVGLTDGSVNSTATDALAIGSSASGQMQTIRVDLVSATKTGTGGYLVTDGAVVRVEKRDPEPLHVMGLVRKPDRYDFPIAEDVRVTDAIALAGGTSQTVCDKIFVIRRKANGSDTAVIQVSLREAKRNSNANLRLAPGDVVSVEQTPATVMMEALNIVRFGISGALPIPGF
ncbi:MAG: polysaccharide biosynthesis/export family protein [Planctomycetota bacterium]